MTGRSRSRTFARGPLAGALVGLAVGVLATLLVVVLLPAGSPGDRDPVESGSLVILSGPDESAGGQRQLLIDKWNQMHPDRPARIELMNGAAAAQQSDAVARAQSGDSGVDIYNLDVTWVAQFASAGYIRPLNRPDTTGFLPEPLRTGTYAGDGKQWALPFNTDAGLLYYRDDLVGPYRAPLPPSSEDIAELVTGSNGLRAGYAGQFVGEGLTVNALEAIWGQGGDVVRDGRVVIESDEARRGLRRLAAALARPADGGPRVANGPDDESSAAKAFRDGTVPFMRNWPVWYASMTAGSAESPTAAAVAEHVRVQALPGHSVLGGQNLAVAADSRSPRAAQQLIEFLTSEESQTTLFADGGFAAVRGSTYVEPRVLERRPYAGTLLTAVREARPRPTTTHYATFSTAFRQVVEYARTHNGELHPDATGMLSRALRGEL